MYEYSKFIVTSDPEVAKQFSASSISITNPTTMAGQSMTYRAAKQVYDTLTPDQKSTLLVDPYNGRNWSRAVSLEYSLGFGEGATENNFKFKLSLVDTFGDLEIEFVENLLNRKRFEESLTDYVGKLSNEEKIKLGLSRLAGQPNLNGLSVNQNALTRSFYFIFINKEDTYLPPIVSQYYKATVDQSQTAYLGNRLLTIEFVTTGHPNIQSHLASFASQKSLYVAEDIMKDVKFLKYEIIIDWDFEKLSNDPKALDAELKKCIRDIFSKVSGKEVILILPDFGKIFNKYKESLGSSLTDSVVDAVAQSAGFTVDKQQATGYRGLKYFLTELGFKFIEPYTNKLYMASSRLSPKDLKSLASFKGRLYRLIEDIKSSDKESVLQKSLNSLDLGAFSRTGRLFYDDSFDSSFGPEDQNYLIENNLKNQSEASYKFNNNYYGPGGSTTVRNEDRSVFDLNKSLIGRLTELKTGKRIYNNQTRQFINFQERKKLLISILEEIFIVKYEKALKAIDSKINVVDSIRAAQAATSSPEIDFSINQNTTKGKLIFYIDSSEPNKSSNLKSPNRIDFNEFLNNFAIKLSSLSNNNFILKFSEECDLSRLSILKETCSYDKYNSSGNLSITKSPLISNDTLPAVVIYDEWMLNHLYAPIDGFIDESKLNNYPISETDLENYNQGSKYQKYLRLERIINGFDLSGILLPFDAPNTASNMGRLLSSFFDFTKGVFLLSEILEQGSNVPEELNTKSCRSLPVFIYKPTSPLATNVLSYNLVADTTNSFVSYNSFIEDTANLIIDDSLQESSMKAIIESLGNEDNVKTAKKDLEEYMKTSDPQIIDGLKDLLRKYVSNNLSRKYNVDFGGVGALDIVGNEQQKSLLEDYNILNKKQNKTPEEEEQLRNLFDTLTKASSQQQEVFISNIINDLQQNYLLYPDDKGVFSLVKTYISDNNSLTGKAIRRYNLTNHLYNKIYTLNIKTYPYFQLNNLFSLNTPVYVLIYKDFSISNKEMGKVYSKYSDLPDYIKKPSVISGFYQIIGFKHIMQLKAAGGLAAHSEFTLRKNINFGSTS